MSYLHWTNDVSFLGYPATRKCTEIIMMFSSHENFLATELYGNLKHDVSVHEMHRNVLGNYNNYHHKHARGGGGHGG